MKTMRLFQRVNITTLQVFDKLNLKHLGICQVADAARCIIFASFLRSGETPPSDDNLKIPLGDRADNQRLKNSVNADAFGKLSERIIFDDATRIGLGWNEDVKGKVAVLGCGGGIHGGSPYTVARSGALERTASCRPPIKKGFSWLGTGLRFPALLLLRPLSGFRVRRG